MKVPGNVSYRLDRDVAAQHSVIRRYAPALYHGWLDDDVVTSCSRREGLRLLELASVSGVRIYLLDESSCMTTGTYKSLDGCVTTSASLQSGARQLVFSSGANTGSALTAYANRVGIETFFFCPASTLHKVDARLLAPEQAHFIAVEGPDARVKEAASHFAEAIGAPLVPTVEWRLAAAGSRGMFIAELIKEQAFRFTWMSQAVCAAFGPIGLYRVLYELVRQGELDRGAVPRFLGIQQAGLAPLVEAWSEGRSQLDESPTRSWCEPPIEPSLYNANPTITYPRLFDVLQTTGGDMAAVTRDEFDREHARFLAFLKAVGVNLTMTSAEDDAAPVEKAGLLCGVGTLRAIAKGRIRSGESVLCSLSGGVLPSIPQPVAPDCHLAADTAIEDGVAFLVKHFSAAGDAHDGCSGRRTER
ncbi:MAG: pyridoxal-phosphate dependent enzyme [Deltaproteobacteria bacterium]|nr:pyridoxal-phosphate dependent enzyme [Deltaproteobacteria bacterium]